MCVAQPTAPNMMLGGVSKVLSPFSHAVLRSAGVCTMEDLQFVVAVSNGSTPVAEQHACICSAQ